MTSIEMQLIKPVIGMAAIKPPLSMTSFDHDAKVVKILLFDHGCININQHFYNAQTPSGPAY